MIETYEHEERFWSKVDASGGCWVWTASIDPNGYGKYSETVGGKKRYPYAHRYAYTALVGPIPEGLTIDHLCKNRKCVNPDHLEAVTLRVNILRSDSPPARQARQARCKRGHELTPDNTYTSSGYRQCRACWKMQNHEQYLKRKAAAS